MVLEPIDHGVGREAWDVAHGAEIIAAYASLDGAALPILHAIQAAFGYVPKQAEPMIADALNLSRAEVHGIVSFYHEFRAEPPGRQVLKLCRAEACQAVGGAALAQNLLQRLGLEWGGTTSNGGLTIEPVYCLGLCACGPAALLNDQPLARLDAHMLAELADAA